MNDHTSALSSPARAKSRGRRLMGVTAAFLVTCSLVGCDSLLDVDLPGDIPADQISNPRSCSGAGKQRSECLRVLLHQLFRRLGGVHG